MVNAYATFSKSEQKVTIDHTKVGGATLTDFPVMIRLAPNKFSTRNALSILQGQTPLYVETEKWTPSEAILWTRVPAISPSTDTILRVSPELNPGYIGDVGTPAARSVWNIGYKAVYHFAGNALDSTQYAHHAQWVGTPGYTAGRVGDAASFNGSNYLTVPDSDDFSLKTSGHLLVSTHFSPAQLVMPSSRSDGQIRFLSKSASNQHEWCMNYYNEGSERDQGIAFYIFNLDGGLGTGHYMAPYGDPDNIIGVNEWEHLMGRGDESAAVIHGSTRSHWVSTYKNGGFRYGQSLDSTAPITPTNGTAPVTIGHSLPFSSYLIGRLDEVRVDSAPRSDAWIQADYYSQMGQLAVASP